MAHPGDRSARAAGPDLAKCSQVKEFDIPHALPRLGNAAAGVPARTMQPGFGEQPPLPLGRLPVGRGRLLNTMVWGTEKRITADSHSQGQ